MKYESVKLLPKITFSTLHCAQPDAGQRECTDRHLEMEQLPGYGGIGFGPEFLATDWVLGQFGKNLAQAQKRYRDFVREGLES